VVVDICRNIDNWSMYKERITCYKISAKWRLGFKDEARLLFEELLTNEDLFEIKSPTDWGRYYTLAGVYSTFGDNKKALSLIKEDPWSILAYGKSDAIFKDPLFENLWNNPELQSITAGLQDKKAVYRSEVREMIERGELDL